MNLVDILNNKPLNFCDLKDGTMLIVSGYSSVADQIFGQDKSRMNIHIGDFVIIEGLKLCIKKGSVCMHCISNYRFFVRKVNTSRALKEGTIMAGCHFKFKTLNGRLVVNEYLNH